MLTITYCNASKSKPAAACRLNGSVLDHLTWVKENHCPGQYTLSMAKKFPIHPIHPERVCWGCDKYCPADSLACGNGSVRTQHPVELFGDDWQDWGIDANKDADPASG